MRDLALQPSNASSHVAKRRRRGHPRGSRTLDLSTQNLRDVLAEPRVARVPDRRFDDCGVDAHLATTRHATLSGLLDDSREQPPQNLAIEKLPEPNHRLGVRNLPAIDPAEVPVDEVARHFPLELLVAPLLQVLQNEQPQRDLSGRAFTATTCALLEATAHRVENAVNQLLIVEDLVDASKGRGHQRARVRRAKENGIPERALAVAPTNHDEFRSQPRCARRSKIDRSVAVGAGDPRRNSLGQRYFCTAV